VAASTASTFIPSTLSAVTPQARALSGISTTDSARSIRVPIAYRLFSQRKSTGSFQSEARFSASWNSPSATAPSPKTQAVTRIRPCRASANARPTAIGRPPPTIALPP
jgi:hypothetical protein